MCDFSGGTYANPPVIYRSGSEEPCCSLIDVSMNILKVEPTHVCVKFEYKGFEELISCGTDGDYSSLNSVFFVSEGRRRLKLADFLTGTPIIFRTTDDVMIHGTDYTSGDLQGISYDASSVVPIDWEFHKTDIRAEASGAREGMYTLHTTLKDILMERGELKHIVYDHSSGEIADFIAMEERENQNVVTLYHVKRMNAAKYNSGMEDIYEVAGQAVKSTIWLTSPSMLIRRMHERRKSGNCRFIRGTFDEFCEEIKGPKLFRGRIIIVQPSISYRMSMPSKFQAVLAAARHYVLNSGKVSEFEIWGS